MTATLPRSRLIALVRDLGYNPDDVTALAATGREVTVTRLARDDQGRTIIIHGKTVTEDVIHRVEDDG